MITFLGKHSKFRVIKVLLILTLFVATTSAVMTIQPEPAQAICCSDCCFCFIETFIEDLTQWIQTVITIALYIFINLIIHQLIWFDMTYWEQHMLPALMHMGNQLSAVGALQVSIIGKFIDAKEQLETQRLLQELHARASKDYHPSIGMCEFGTRMLSLAASERKGEANALILSERSSDRFFGHTDTSAQGGRKDDVTVRMRHFQNEYCDTFDSGRGLTYLCPALTPPNNAAQKDRFNKDIDYQRTIQDPWTIGFDLTTAPNAPSQDDEDVVAMSNSLYGYDAFDRADFASLQNLPNQQISNAQQAYLDLRSTVAKIKVAENSYNALVAMKGEGTLGSRAFIVSYLEELGIPTAEIDDFVGVNPSYNAQMEILTKKAYQTPIFYTNLYDKPANIARKGVAMQAIGLIQKFDLLKSYLRTEASLSVLLELSVNQLQREVEDNIRTFNTDNPIKE